MLLLAASLAPLRADAAPGDILFSDNFERATLGPWTTTDGTRSGILTGAQVSNSPTRGAYTRHNVVTITSPSFGAAVPAARLSYWVRRGSDAFSEDPDAGEDLVLEYRRADLSWAQIALYDGAGINGQIYNDVFLLPPDALHGNLAIRARQNGGSGSDFDYWHLDDVVVTEIATPAPLGVGTCDDFENGLSGNWSIVATGGFAGTSGATFQSPTQAMYTNGGAVQVVSNVIDTSDPSFSNLTMWIRRGSDAFSENPEGSENLVVEYLNNVSAWVALETFAGGGTAGQIYLRSYNLPAAGRHANFQVRVRQTGGSGSSWDFWHVDDVCFEQLPMPSLLVAKSVQTLSDPFNGITDAKAIPGATLQYTVTVTNQGQGTVDANTLAITDPVPANTALYVDTSGGDPIVFIDGAVASGLGYNFATDVSFSNQVGGGAPYTYVPTPDADGYDAAVTGYQIVFTGAMNGATPGNVPSFTIQTRIRVQ
jgi:uncharacterized repeat protein (TIGR01451 family)